MKKTNITQGQQPPDGANPTAHPVYHIQHLLQQLRATFKRPEPYRHLRHLFVAELMTLARKTLTQLVRTLAPWLAHDRPLPTSRYYRLFQRSWHPDRAFHLLFQQTLTACPPDQPYCLVADGTAVPRTGKRMPGVYWHPNPQDAPFQRGLGWAQRFVMLGWLPPDEAGFTRCLPVQWLPAFSPNSARALPASRRAEIEAWEVGVRQVRAWLDASGRAAQWLVCIGDGRGDTKAWGTLGLPNTVCCVRTRKDSLWCELPASGERGRLYGRRRWRPQEVWRERTGWRPVGLTVRGRWVALWVKVKGPCRRVGWGERVFYVIVVRGHRSGRRGVKERPPQAFWVQAVSDGRGGWQLPWGVEWWLGLLWQRWMIEVSFRELKSGFGLGEKQCWGLVSGERSVAWSAWVYGVLLWSGYRAWGWLGGERWGGRRRRCWTLRDVVWSVRVAWLEAEGALGGLEWDWAKGGLSGGSGGAGIGRVVQSWLCQWRL
ncbi:MAG: hypothetical protein KatS3mg021_2325 [Fimbriimonadales bacterium]|jgi:hypothetical protein|nr:MAG: hypothetical protein KatS3mg021_0621 [Fimbriimonadales bacterium]GIV13802.1 MAG: hypothetical protein KatS3mg021_2084 [Fimbriimonadales bacterium]GIV14043.1 MAG: hypothetical protein KatS3mg021_2325 [Fimbriimonadales bacterium]